MTTKKQAELLGIATVDADGNDIHHKTLAKLIASHETKAGDAPEEVRAIESKDLLRLMAEQRLKTGKLNPYAKQAKTRTKKAKTRSKIHSQAADK